jgi:hypothetical protein
MKKFIIVLMLASFLFILSGCGKTAKETYTEAYQNLLTANTYEATSVLDLEITADHAANNPAEMQMLNFINTAEIAMDTRVDTEKEISEVVFHIKANQGPMSINLDIPLHVDDKEKKLFIKTETIQQALAMVPMFPLPQDFSFDKEFVEFDITSEVNVEEQEKMKQQMLMKINELVNDVPEERFQANKDEIQVNLEDDDIHNLIVSFAEFAMEQSGEMMEEGSTQDIKELLDEVTFNSLNMKAKINDGNIQNESISLSMEAGEGDENAGIAVAMANEYKNINKNVEFTMEPTEENTMNQQELEQQLNEVMMQMTLQAQ